ncbi:class I SAM-dependent methyltransferase [Nocardioides sp.]|uniref:class I SAM-dependent methyltransferase n=1 Tax=Nocardioides sp. TaxID=35761 RepID=UPI0039E3E200
MNRPLTRAYPGHDPVLDADWAENWRELVAARDATVGPRDTTYWDERAQRYAQSVSGQDGPLLDLLGTWLTPDTTVLDVGAGTGRHAVPLAQRVRLVVAVEPSKQMRARIPPTPGLEVVAADWLAAGDLRADVVTCLHTLYPIANPVPFLRKLDQAAKRRVVVAMRDDPSAHPAEVIAGGAREPLLRHLVLLLRQMGIAPDVKRFRYTTAYHFDSFEEARDDCRARAGARWDDERGTALLRQRLRPRVGGGVTFDGGTMTAGIAHWTPGG